MALNGENKAGKVKYRNLHLPIFNNKAVVNIPFEILALKCVKTFIYDFSSCHEYFTNRHKMCINMLQIYYICIYFTLGSYTQFLDIKII